MTTKPNILFICTDQQRGDCLGVDGHPVLMTPNMDNIAYNGVRFRHAYSSCPTCIPARISMMLGQTQEKHRIVGYQEGVEMHDPTLPEVLRDNGYQTGLVGRSMHMWPPRKRYGFEEMTIMDHRQGVSDYDDWLEAHMPEGSGGWHAAGVKHNDWTACPWPFSDHLHCTNWTVTEALRFLRRRDPSRPFFLTVSFLAPHPPLQPPLFYFDRYMRTGVPDAAVGDWARYHGPHHESDSVAPHAVELQGEALLSTRAAYYGLINHIDDQLRRLLNPVDGLLSSNTIILFTSDHGEMLGDHHMWRKARAYESSARVPFLLAGPKDCGIPHNTVQDAVVTHADIMPTLLELAGVDIPSSVNGKSLMSLLRGDAESVRDYLHVEHAPVHHALTDGNEKFIWEPADGAEQYFDLRQDPQECRNLVDVPEMQERVALWRTRMIELLKERPEGFSDGKSLVPGRPYLGQLPEK